MYKRLGTCIKKKRERSFEILFLIPIYYIRIVDQPFCDKQYIYIYVSLKEELKQY